MTVDFRTMSKLLLQVVAHVFQRDGVVVPAAPAHKRDSECHLFFQKGSTSRKGNPWMKGNFVWNIEPYPRLIGRVMQAR
jgi:hypothetical protein